MSSKKTNNKLEIIDDNDESSNKTILEDTNMEDVQNNKKQSFTIKSHTKCNNTDSVWDKMLSDIWFLTFKSQLSGKCYHFAWLFPFK